MTTTAQTTLLKLKSQRLELLSEARDIAQKAEGAGRDFTDAERARVAELLSEAKSIGVDVAPPSTKARGAAVNSWGKAVRKLGTKALVPSGTITVPLLDEAFYGFGFGPTLLTEVIPTTNLEGTDRFKFIRQSVRTNNAAAVAPGGLKPTSVVSVEPVEGKAEVIATLSEPIENTLVADANLLEDFIANELRGMVNTEVNDQLINGDGVSPNLEGILATSGVQVQTFDTSALVSLRKGKTKVGTVYDGLQPDRVLVNPNDAESLDLETDLEGRFYFGGPVGGNAEQTWRVPVFETTAVPEFTAIIGNFRLATRAYVREEVKVDWSEAVPIDVAGTLHAAFELNQRVYRAEARVGLAVLRPTALVSVELTAGGS